MKLLYLIISALLIGFICLYYLDVFSKDGKLIKNKFYAPSLVNNIMGENPLRSLHVYLPKGYFTTNKKYPCLYFLHGFDATDESIKQIQIHKLLNKAIENKILPELIVVFPNSHTKFKGSFYTNSESAGKWADYIGIDIVHFVDSQYRTIKHKDSRGILGHSMGGNGALKIAMLFPEVFGSVYALSPSILYWSEELIPTHPAFLTIQNANQLEDVINDLYPIGFLAMGSTYSANPNHPPFYCDMPVTYKNNQMQIDSIVFKKWDHEFPLKMAESHIEALKSLNGIGFDWGKQDEFLHLPVTCVALDKLLIEAGIPHFAEGYTGNHMNRIAGYDGRVYQHVFPFFSKYLKY